MNILEGYSYHIKDDFFTKVPTNGLMSNKEDGGYRPHYFCIEDAKISGLYWVIPISSKTEKYQDLVADKIAKYGKCNTIILGNFGGKLNAFLLQNMFPTIEKYFDHVHTINDFPVSVHQELDTELRKNLKDLIMLTEHSGKKVVFPDIVEIKRIMVDELKDLTSNSSMDT